jgi:hypothetical protein
MRILNISDFMVNGNDIAVQLMKIRKFYKYPPPHLCFIEVKRKDGHTIDILLGPGKYSFCFNEIAINIISN